MQDNIIKVVPLEDILEFTMTKPTKEELNIIHSYGFFLEEYFIQDNCIYFTFRREEHD